MENIRIKEILEKDITRNINGVVKAESSKSDTTITELSEYVITDEVGKYLRRLLDRYADSINSPTEEMGIWISGFFGSGKSHLLKMLGHIFENKEYNGKKTSEYFGEKIDDGILMGNLEKASEKETDVIIFNIDNVSDQDTYQNKDAIAVALLKKFNEHLGFSRDDIKIAGFERRLWKLERFEEFKELFKEMTDEEWTESRRNLAFISDDFVEVVEEMEIKGFGLEAAERWIEKDTVESINAESLSDILEEYLEIKGKNHRIMFLVDEVGQYIGDNSNLMLNLQTVTEEIGKRFEGKVWVGVTSQQDIGAILEDNESKRYDYSKIQGRFKTMISLSSGNIDEVIKKRLLSKKSIEGEDLENYYEKKRVDITNLISFDKKGATLKLYDNKKDFSETYPFVGYQFNLLQTVFEKVRNMGHSGKHMSRGERSLLSSFQEAGIKMKDETMGSLVPFNYFYDSIEQFLEDNARRPFIHAEKDKGCEKFDIDVLKLLFLLKGIDTIEPNLNNLTSFMIDNIDCDRIKKEEDIKKSLRKLEKEGLIQKDGDTYYFLTNIEQDIEREILQEDVDMAGVYRELNNQIFEEIYDKNTVLVDESKNKYTFNKYIDEFTFGRTVGQLDIRILTPNGEDYGNELIIGNREGYNLILKLSEKNIGYLDEIKYSLKVESYIKKKNGIGMKENIEFVIQNKQRENAKRKKRIREEIERAFEECEVYIGGHKQEVKTKDAKKIIDNALKQSANYLFSKAKLVKKKYDEKKIKEILSCDFDGATQLFDITKDKDKNPNKDAIDEVERKINHLFQRGMTVTLKTLLEYFSAKPYGWDVFSVNGIVAELWVYKGIDLEETKIKLVDSKEIALKLIKIQPKNLEKIVVKKKEEIDTELINKVNNLLKKLWGSTVDNVTIEDPKKELIAIVKRKKNEASMYISDCERNDYPGKKQLKDYKELLEEFEETKGNTEKLLKEFLDMKDEFEDAYEDVSDVFDFFKTSKKNRFDEGRKKVKEVTKYQDFVIGVEELEEYQNLVNLLASKKPYGEIRKIEGYILEIDKKMKVGIDAEIEKLKKSVENYKVEFEKLENKEIVEEIFREFDRYIREIESVKTMEIFYKKKRLENIVTDGENRYKKAVNSLIVNIERETLKALDDKDNVEELEKKIKDSFATLRNRIGDLKDTKRLLEEAELDSKGFIGEANGKKPKKKRVRIKRVTSKSKYNLETKEEVDSYIDELKSEIERLQKEMLEAIDSNKIVNVE